MLEARSAAMPVRRPPSAVALALVASLALVSCGDDGASSGTGTVSFSTWGEDFIEVGIPASAFADGWSVTYTRFLVLVGRVRVADAGGDVAAEQPGFVLVDHVSPGVKPVATFDGIEAKAWTQVSYETSPVGDPAAIALGQGATEADRDLVVASGCHAYVAGTMTDGATTKTFAWCLGVPTLLDACEGEIDGKRTEGVVVTEGGEDQVELTIHGDHLFYDDLQAADAELRAQAYADADADGDGDVTLDELAAVDLDDLPVGTYGTGSATGVGNLRQFVEFLSRTLGHFRGEGECLVKDP
jgi:hypothetical protein